MNKILFFTPLLLLGACGIAENENQMTELANSNESNEDGLGLASADGFSMLKGKLINAKTAFDSAGMIVKADANGNLVRKCSGAFAYEVDAQGIAQLYFFTAAHCTEDRNPLGRLENKPVDTRLRVRALVHKINSSKTTVKERIVSGTPQGFVFNSNSNYQGEKSDIARYFVKSISASEALGYLPICGSQAVEFDSFPDSPASGKQVISARRDLSTLGWRNFGDASREIPKGLSRILNDANSTPYRRANGISPRPGDSGSPVYVFERGAGATIERFNCLKGIVTRESWIIRGDCKLGNCTLVGSTIYERIRRTGSKFGTWRSL
ncbi:MAG: hypothetical protein RLZZ488_1221 [Pseudomonadota bacterium]|jgi:hypothetical protein